MINHRVHREHGGDRQNYRIGRTGLVRQAGNRQSQTAATGGAAAGNAEVLLGRNRQVSQEGFFFTHLCPLWKFDFALLWLTFSLRPKHPRNEHREKLQGGDLERKIHQRVQHDSCQRKHAGR